MECTRTVILVEAKAHIEEMFSSGSRASTESLKQILDALNQTIAAFRATLSDGKSTRASAFSS
jgi:hypothetical protein